MCVTGTRGEGGDRVILNGGWAGVLPGYIPSWSNLHVTDDSYKFYGQ